MALVQNQEVKKPKKGPVKTVRWQEPTRLEEVKYFKMNDAPSAPSLTVQEVNEIQKHLADVPAHMIPSELQKIEMMMDRKVIEMNKDRERGGRNGIEDNKGNQLVLRRRLMDMKPTIRFTRKLISKCIAIFKINTTILELDQGDFNMELGQESTEIPAQ
jgi:hypothetical protein